MRNIEKLAVLTALAFVASGCDISTNSSSTISTDVKNSIAICSSAVTVSDSAKASLETSISETLTGESSVSASAGIESSVKGIFSEETLKTDNGLKAFELYNSCIQSELSQYID